MAMMMKQITLVCLALTSVTNGFLHPISLRRRSVVKTSASAHFQEQLEGRRHFIATAAAAVLVSSTSLPAMAESAAPGGVLGEWSVSSTVDEVKEATVTFERSGDATLRIGDASYPSIREWKSDTAGRYLNDKGKIVSFAIELPSDVFFFSGTIEDANAATMTGSVSLDGSDKSVGKFTAVLSKADVFVKKRAAFAPYVPKEGATVLELNGRARWAVEKEMAEASRNNRSAKPTTTNEQNNQQSSVYLQLKPTDLQGYAYPSETPNALP